MLYNHTYLRHISISHQWAPVARRERFHMAESEKARMAASLRKAFPDVSALLLLVTCNRTELYFESEHTPAAAVRNWFMKAMTGEAREEDLQDFKTSDRTEDTVHHLLRVSAGLESSVLGDAEIIHQIKKAYHAALDQNLQGSLLERCMQSLFRCHKRVSNETHFRDGTTSTAYKALSSIRDVFGVDAPEKKILFVGAGDIVRQLFKYNTKFGYRNVWITNRTESKARRLAESNKAAVWPWALLQRNELSDFDVIISAASHAPSLIRSGMDPNRRVLLVDLAVPGNFAPGLRRKDNIILEDLDSISAQLEQNKEARAAAAANVHAIVEEEWESYLEWYRMQPFRNLMASRKAQVLELLVENGISTDQGWDTAELSGLTNRIMRKVLKRPEMLHDGDRLSALVSSFLPAELVTT